MALVPIETERFLLSVLEPADALGIFRILGTPRREGAREDERGELLVFKMVAADVGE